MKRSHVCQQAVVGPTSLGKACKERVALEGSVVSHTQSQEFNRC